MTLVGAFLGIKLPPAVRKRGRPKGQEATVIGLPQKGHTLRNKPKPFCKLHTSEKEISKLTIHEIIRC